MVHADLGFRRGFLLLPPDEAKKESKDVQPQRKTKPTTSGMKAGFLLQRPSKPIPRGKTSKSQAALKSTARTNHPDSALKIDGTAKGNGVSKPTTETTKTTSRQNDYSHPASLTRQYPCQDLLVLENPPESSTSKSNQPSSSLILIGHRAESIDIGGRSRCIHEGAPRTLISIVDQETDADTRTARSSTWVAGDDTRDRARGAELDSVDKHQASLIGPKIPKPPSSSSSVLSDMHGTPIHTPPAEQSAGLLGETALTGDLAKADDRSVTFLEFQQELLRMNWEEASKTTISAWSSNHVSWAWQWLLVRPRTSIAILSDLLLQHHPQSMREFLTPGTPQDRAISLQIIQLAQNFLSKEDIPLQFLEIWEIQILADLGMLVAQSNRSVLAQEAWTTSILLIDRLSVEGNWTSSPYLIRDLQETTERLLQTQLQWKRDKKRKDTRREAWIFLIQEWNEESESYRKHSLVGSWQRLVRGCWLEQGRRWGGLRHIFCSDKFASTSCCWNDIAMAWTALRRGDDEATSHICERKYLLRGLLAKLASIKTFECSVREEMIENILSILPNFGSQTECSIAVLIVRVICSDNRGFPADLESNTITGLPNLIQRILSSLPRRLSQEERWKDMDTLSFFVAGCMARLENHIKTIETFVDEQGLTPFTINVLCDLLSIVQRNADVEYNPADEVQYLIQDIFVGRIAAPSVRTYLGSAESYSLWKNMGIARVAAIATRLLGLFSSTDEHDTLFVEIQSVAVSSIAMMTNACLSEGTQLSLLRVMTTFLCEDSSSSDDKKIERHFFSIVGARWRDVLLGQLSTPETHFSDLVLASAQEVLLHPSSPAALAVFGIVLGQDIPNFVHSVEHSQTRIQLTMHTLMKLCSNQLEESFNRDDWTVFQRLAPLLLLRRVPSQYFLKAGMSERNTTGVKDIQKWTTILASQVAKIFGFSGDPERSRPHELRLAAEVAGRLLKFGMDPSSTLQLICVPFFSDVIKKSTKGLLGSDAIESVQKARLALYAACFSLQPTEGFGDDTPCHEYYSVASFAILVLDINVDESDDNVRNELVQLQTGCIEFFTICMMQKNQDPSRCRDPHIVAPCTRVSLGIQNLLKHGYPDPNDEWIVGAFAKFVPTANTTQRAVGHQALICLWNAMALVAQRLESRDGTLGRFARTNVWIAECTRTERHPLVTSAAMQAIFITLTRLKELSCFGDHQGTVVTIFHDWAFGVLQANDGKAGSTQNTLRLVALKLVLCLLSLKKPTICSGPGYLLSSPERLGATFNLIERLARTDPSTEIRTLSMQILGLN